MMKIFYSFDHQNMYRLHKGYGVDALMNELETYNGVLIYADDDKLEFIEYNDGREVEFDTRLIFDLGDSVVVTRKKSTVKKGE